MKAIEVFSKTDREGILKMSYHLNGINKDVKVIILYDNTKDEDEEVLWMNSIKNNPAFNFLMDKNEDMYSFDDGEPLND
ncbi:MAG: hypothetical protein K9H16_12295 [Bacteroidales bacterium]|nr:hypothetical protein [Bacteroidales bacterium]